MVIKEVTMPKLGESVTEGTISAWLVRPGDVVKKFDPLAEVMTDKVNAEIPASYEGTIEEILVDVDEPVSVGTPICTIRVASEEKESVEEKNDSFDGTQKRRHSPVVRRLSKQYGIDLEKVAGTGRGGRITRKDLLAFIERQQVEKATETIAEKTVTTGDVTIPVTGVRKAIADKMTKSKLETPHAWMMVEVDVTNLVRYRNERKEQFEREEGVPLTYLPFFVKAVVEALKEYPELNSMWAGDRIIRKKEINISIAVATDDALYVPVIQRADEKSVKGIALEIDRLAKKVRNGTITPEEMQGGTFTVNNTGTFGSILSTPIINHPQAAILSIESIVKRPVVIETEAGDMIAIRSIVHLCLSLDHRVLDGLVCGRFLARVKEKLENISPETMPI